LNPDPLTLQLGTFLLDNCSLQSHMGVNNLPNTKFEVCKITCYEDMKGNAKCRNCGRLG